MNEQVREQLREILMRFARVWYNGNIMVDIGHVVDGVITEIAALMPKPLDVEELLCELEDYIAYGYQSGGKRLNIPVDEFKAIAARFCAPLAEPPDVTMIRQFEYNRGYEDAQNEPTMTISTTSEVAPVERVCRWKTEDRIAHVIVSTDCGKAFSYPCARCELVDKFGPYCTCGSKIKIEGEK